MSAARDLPARPSLDSLRKQAKRLVRDAAAGNGEAIARVHAQLPRARLPLSNRDAQLVIAREYGFAGWSALTADVQERVGDGLAWSASRAKVAIHNENHEQLRALLAEYPALVTWRDESDQRLLDSTTSYAWTARTRSASAPTRSNIATQLLRFGAPGMPERLFYMYLPAEMLRLANPQRGEPPLLFPQAKYFTVNVPFTPADLEAATQTMACHKTQFSAEAMQRFLPARDRVWNGAVAFVPESPALSGDDLFRK